MAPSEMIEFKIQTPRLLIRNLKTTDLEDFYIYRSNPEVTKYQGFDVMTKDKANTFINQQLDKQFGKPGEWIQYGIENRNTGKIVGDCAIHLQKFQPEFAEIGVTISHLEQRKGFAKEAMFGIVNFLFETKNIRRIIETVDAENEASINLLKSLGFRQEAHFIENIFFKGKWGSEYQFAMLKSEWDNRKQQIKKGK